MSNESITFLLQIMAVFTGVAAVSLFVQMVVVFLIYRSVNKVSQRSSEFMTRWEPLAATANETLDNVRVESQQILAHVKEIAETSKSRVGKLDDLVEEVSASARKQIDRVDDAMGASIARLHETSDAYQQALLQPVQQIRGVTAAATAVLDHLFGRRRSTVDRATQDEELFI